MLDRLYYRRTVHFHFETITMLFFSRLLNIFALYTTIILAHTTETNAEGNVVVPDPKYSLPDLLTVKSIPNSWNAIDQTTLEEGRIILTPKQNSKGSLWLKSPVKLGEAFTIEWTVRSVKYVGKSTGGISFWLISSDNKKDSSLYNGPAQFNGFQILVDNNSPLGPSVRGLLNDGSIKLDQQTIYDKSFASCLMGYQDSSVPITLRLSYSENLESSNNYFLKLQIDNRVCFQTNKIKLPLDSYSNNGQFNIGVTADNANTDESFEVLQMKYYDSVIEDVLIPNVNSMPQPKMIAKVIDTDTGKEKLVDKEVLDEMNDQTSNYLLYKKLDKLEGKILANDISDLEAKLEIVIKNQINLVEQMNHLVDRLTNDVSNNGNSKSSMNDEQFKDFYAMNEKLEKMMDDAAQLREASQKQQLLQGPNIPTDEIVRKLAVWLFPLVLIMVVMAYYTFKIRQEIVKTKLL